MVTTLTAADYASYSLAWEAYQAELEAAAAAHVYPVDYEAALEAHIFSVEAEKLHLWIEAFNA